ncbi:hypothetical protein ACEPMY_01235 [Ralstonia pseudosolanacearum]|uniref:hypothetical protein n=1 Tax=Ralstonia pseudosolanacearum TaxID=1310165 RepID=UPI0038701D70
MSIQDREWYQEELRRKAQQKNATREIEQPQRIEREAGRQPLRDIPGANWHWSVKLIALGWLLVLIMMAMRYIGR